jgi:hypothetical protein
VKTNFPLVGRRTGAGGDVVQEDISQCFRARREAVIDNIMIHE